MASVRLKPQLVRDTSRLSLPLDHLLFVGRLVQLIHLIFSLACIIKTQQLLNYKMASVRLKPQLVRDTSRLSLPLDHLLFVGRLAQLIHLIFSLACITKTQQLLNYKMASVRLKPQLVRDTSRLSLPLDHLLFVGRLVQLIHLIFSLACIIKTQQLLNYKMASVRLKPQLVRDTSRLSLPLDHLLFVGRLVQLIHLIFSLACIIKTQQLLNYKMASVRLKPQLVRDTSRLSLPLDHLLVVGRLAQLIHLIFFLACITKTQQLLNYKMASVRLKPQLVRDTSRLSLSLDHLLFVGRLVQLIHLIFSLACIIKTQQLLNYKMASVRLKPQLVRDTSRLSLPLDHLLFVGRLAQLIHLIFSLACITKTQQLLNYKMASVRLKPQLVRDTSRLSLPLDHLLFVGRLVQLIHLIFSLACIIKTQQLLNYKMASVRLKPQLVRDTSRLSLPLDHLLVVGRLAQLIHLIFFLACITKTQQLLNYKMASVRLKPQLVRDTSRLSLSLDHLLFVGRLVQLIHLIFSLACIIKTQQLLNYKMASVRLKPQLVRDTSRLSLPLDHLLFVGRLAQLIHLIFSLACITKTQQLLNYKMASVRLKPQLVRDTSRLSLPLDHLLFVGRLVQLIHLIFSLACIIKTQQLLNYKMASVRLKPQLVRDTSRLSLPLDHLLVVGRLAQLIHLIFSLACITKTQQLLNYKMASVRLKPQLVRDTSRLSLPLDHLLVVGRLEQLIHIIFFSNLYN